MSHKVNLVRVFTAATGNSSPITLGAAYSQLFMTPAEAGAMNGRVYTYLLVDGNDWELGKGAYTASGTTLARTMVLASRISGTLGTSRISLSGTAQVRFIESAEDMDGVRGTRAVTATSDVIANSDQGYVVTYSNAAAVAVSLAHPSTSNLFIDGWATTIQNLGVGVVTVTPATSTINGASSLTLAQNMGAYIWSDGTNYHAYFVPVTKPVLAGNNLSDVDAATARANLGGTTVGDAVFTAASAAAARKSLGIVCTPQGRLTLVTGVPVITSSQISKTTLYYTPAVGNQIPIYDGSAWTPTSFSELSASTTDTTKSPAALTALKVVDWFVWNDAGTLRLSHGGEWSAETVRALANSLTLQDGIWVNANAITNGPGASRGTYVGTTYTDGSAQLDMQFGVSGTTPTRGFFGVWNAYNRRRLSTQFADTTSSYTYSGSARIAHSGNYDVLFVVGIPEDVVEASYSAFANQGGSPAGGMGIGFNTSSGFSGPVASVGTTGMMQRGDFVGYPGTGVNHAYAIEASGSGQTITVQSGGANFTGGLSFNGWF